MADQTMDRAPYRPMPRANDTRYRAGRASQSNAVGRYERYHRELTDDATYAQADAAPAQTHVSYEAIDRVLTYNRSPDLPFDRSVNPYRGCEHGCIYCFARPTHTYLGMSAGLDFETKLIARPGAPEALERALRKRSYTPAPIAIGTNTDPYQPIEADLRITRGCLKILAQAKHPVAIVTKGTLIERDIDILAPMARDRLVRVGLSVTSMDPGIARAMEPRVPGPARKFETIRRLTDAGIPVRIMVSPVIPGLTDPDLEAILAEGREAGADLASWIMLRLPLEVGPLFREWLEARFPDAAQRVLNLVRDTQDGELYQSGWHRRMRGTGPYADLIAQRFKLACKRLGYETEAAPLRRDLFVPPCADRDQLSLF